ncbi:hypothetical protein M0R45_030896 [Rubus argutus]|uniref:Uncharacterized protein n=1 Tax=Rubus argutus TaxID=59490 RepID=A0AAW1WCH3_RUBAR
MEQWNYTWDDSRNFEHPWYFQNQCIEPPHPLLPYFEMTAAHLQKSLADDDERWRETQERSAKIDQLIKQIEANRLLKQHQELTNQQPCEFFDPNPLLVNHEFTLKEDGNREEKLVLPGIGLEDCDIMHSRSNKGVDKEAGGEENVPSGKLILDQVFKKADANVPSLDLIEIVPAYAQFLKNLHLHKRRFADNERFQLNEEVSAIIQHRLPQWKHEFGSFIIGCRIGDETFDGALMDLNTNVNIMPLATYRRLAIGPLKTTSVSLQLVDGATRLPVGIVEDVLIKVNKFILPADFVVLDMNEDLHKDQECTVCLKVLGEKVKLQVCQPCYTQEVIKEVFATDLVKGNQAKSERIFGPLNPPKPQVEDHSSVVAANQELQELSYLDDEDDDMFEDFVNSYGKNDREFAFSSLESEPDMIVASTAYSQD